MMPRRNWSPELVLSWLLGTLLGLAALVVVLHLAGVWGRP